MCVNCGHINCDCNNNINYTFNWNCNPPPTPGPPDPNVCRTITNALCTIYRGPNLDALGLTTNINLEAVISSINITLREILENPIPTEQLQELINKVDILTQKMQALEQAELLAY